MSTLLEYHTKPVPTIKAWLHSALAKSRETCLGKGDIGHRAGGRGSCLEGPLGSLGIVREGGFKRAVDAPLTLRGGESRGEE